MQNFALMVEYKIEEKHREEYLKLLGQLRLLNSGLQLYEGNEQPGLFVEIWPVASEEEAAACKEERLDGRSPWKPISGWTVGGPDRIHAWTFKPILPLN
ncbi:hypothetical protein [Paenibacillus herberti]|uniref:YCII-related domain-containing protein n=1 Tax=Paenibacillus herberti TaxID=1619309 RepID=A0A229NT73_9BACL|nr:hypothetical protein [Paenibacillus herberti]OXM13097.1 hypothetical protein CGZ75_23270 [Paenibacillus herberti]